ncbi:MAG: hypothetical protein PVJ57_21870 [Phycisphaerae bacterium]|jgi:hypothetical protein
MLDPVEFEARGRLSCFTGNVRSTFPIARAPEFWMAYVARDLLRLGVYFRAQALLIQVPGATEYQYLCHDGLDNDLPHHDDDPGERLRGVERGTVVSVLIECLHRLNAPDILEQIPEVRRIEPKILADWWHDYLNREARYESGLLNVVAECLDELIVRPGVVEIDCGPLPTWWQERWAQIRKWGGNSTPVEPDDTRGDD